MIFVAVLLAAGLAFAAWKATDRPTSLILAGACALNLLAGAHMLATDNPYALRLHPQTDAQPGDQHEEARPDRR